VNRYPATPKEWQELRQVVVTYALRLTRNPDRADDLTQEAFKRLVTTRPWNPATQSSLAKHLMTTVKSLLSHERESKQSEYEEKAVIEQRTIDGDATKSAEQMSLDRSESTRSQSSAADQLTDLREALVGHGLELQLIDLTDQGIDDRQEQARITGAKIQEVYDAWRRIRRTLRRLLAARSDDDDEEVA
jgi:DNA-directed RNA polymerase specialized sigma24 family protein